VNEKYPFTLIKENIAKKQGAALDFAIGTHPFPLASEILDWIRKNSDLALAPAKPGHIAEFASAASDYLKRQYKLDISPQCVLPTAGGRAGMSILAACTLSAADTVVVTQPGYPAFARIAAQQGARVVASNLDPRNKFSPDFEYNDDVVRGSVSMVAVNYPNNPSGALFSSTVCDKLKSLAGQGTTIFNDATYGPLVYDDRPRSLLSVEFPAEDLPDVVEIHSFSKLNPIGPLAVSFLVGSPNLIQSMATYSEYAWSPLSRLHLAATGECLNDDERIGKFRNYIPKKLESLQSTLNDIGFKTFDSSSGTYLLSDVPKSIGGVSISSASSAAQLLMDSFDIAVVPLDTQFRSYLRFTALYRLNDLERLAALGSRLQLQ